MIDPAIGEAARRLLGIGEDDPSFRVETLAGGANNRLYRVGTDRGAYVAKLYFADPGEGRDRLAAELSFSSFAWGRGIRCIPEPIARDVRLGMGIYRFVEGRPPRVEEVDRARVDEALRFFVALNRSKTAPEASRLPNAAEACFSVREHLGTVARRLTGLADIEVRCEVDLDARELVRNDLAAGFARIEAGIEAAARSGDIPLEERLAPEERVVSPSDFGFHNALIGPDGALTFLDFEYAGWDDPAKTACDFVSQVALPVPEESFDVVVETVGGCVQDAERLKARARLLLPLYRLKWCCILLNEFSPAGLRRRAFAGRADANAKRHQLEKARRQVGLLRG